MISLDLMVYIGHTHGGGGGQRAVLSQLCQFDLKLNPDLSSEASLLLSVYLQLTVK